MKIAVPVVANGEFADGPSGPLFGQGVDAGATCGWIGPGVRVQADEKVGPGLAGDFNPARQTDIDVGRTGHQDAVAARALQLGLERQTGGEGDGAFARLLAGCSGISPAMTGIDDDQGTRVAPSTARG